MSLPKQFHSAMLLLCVASTGCPSDVLDNVPAKVPDEQDSGDAVKSCSGTAIPGAELTVTRTPGPPNTATLQLPALSAVCLRIETNAASAEVRLDDGNVLSPSDFKNKGQTITRIIEDLANEPHTLSIRLTGKPDSHFVTVKAYYATPDGSELFTLETIDQALFLGQAFIDFHDDLTSFQNWKNATAVRALPLFSADGVLEAYEVDVEAENGEDAGYLVLERNELRPLLGAAWSQGPAISDSLLDKYQSTFGEPVADSTPHRLLWAGVGVMALEVTLPDSTERLVKICNDFECPGVTFDSADRSVANFASLGLTEDEWIAQRRDGISEIVEQFLKLNNGGKNQPWEPPLSAPVHPAPNGVGPSLPVSGEEVSFVFTCESDNARRERYVPGEGSQTDLTTLSAYYQEKEKWNQDFEACYAGCVPVAVTILLDYWDRRYSYLIPGELPNSFDEQSVHDTIAALRQMFMTYCKEIDGVMNGATDRKHVQEFLPGFIDGRAKADVGWNVELVPCGKSDSSTTRQEIIWAEIDRGHPAIVHYLATAPLICTEVADEPPSNHAGVAYGYIDDGRKDRFEDSIILAKGWENTKIQVLPIDAVGMMYITKVSPGCWVPGGSGDPCMTFSDIPKTHWGRQSVETLSCMCVIRGYADGTFDLNDSVTKAEFLKMALKLAFPPEEIDLDGVRSAVPEIGVCQSHWASGYIDFARSHGILNAPLLNNGVFLADAPISRQEAAYILAEVAQAGSKFGPLAEKYKCFSELPKESPNKQNLQPSSSLMFPPWLCGRSRTRTTSRRLA